MKEYELGVSTYQLAEKYQCNPSTVQDRLKSMVCEMRGRVEIDIIKLQKEYESGLSTIELGKKYGCAHATIRNKLKHAGYKLRKKGVYKKLINVNIEVLIKEYESGLSTIELGKKYACSSTTILKTLKNSKCFMRNKKENSNKQWDDPEYRKKQSIRAKKQFEDSIARKNASEKQKHVWDDLKSNLGADEIRIMQSCRAQRISRDEWKGFIDDIKYCDKFNEPRRERNRDKYDRKCFICGKPESENITSIGKQRKLSVHHVDKNHNQGCNGHNWILVPLCMNHHGIAHNKLWEARITWLLNNVWE